MSFLYAQCSNDSGGYTYVGIPLSQITVKDTWANTEWLYATPISDDLHSFAMWFSW